MSDKILNLLKSLKPGAENAGKSLLLLNALGMVFAAASNTVASAVDKNTSAEDKKFLIPAGVATGVANISIYYAMTDRLVKKLKDVAGNYVDNLKESDLVDKAAEFAKSRIAKAEKGLFKKPELAESMKQTFFKNGNVADGITDAAKNLYKSNFKAAAGVAGAFIGAVIGSSILTPIIRDVSAYFIQKKMEKNNPELANKPYRPYYDPSRVGTGLYNRRQPLSMKSFMAFTNARSGNMKV